MRWLVFVCVYALIGAYGDEAVNWLSAEYAETAIYQILEVVVLTGLGALIIGLAIGVIWSLIMFVALVISISRSRDPWTG